MLDSEGIQDQTAALGVGIPRDWRLCHSSKRTWVGLTWIASEKELKTGRLVESITT